MFTFHKYHNLSEIGRAAMKKAVWQALKPGDVYAVVDHTDRHMQPGTSRNRRHFDPVIYLLSAAIEVSANHDTVGVDAAFNQDTHCILNDMQLFAY